jgi:GH24 family phage-related lysozyme (muramidase)
VSGTLDRCIKLTHYFFTSIERPDAILGNQLQEATKLVDGLVARPLVAFQRDALLCLLSDLLGGHVMGKFPDSILLHALNRGMFQIAAGEFHSFCLVHGRPNQRAWQKRRCEQFLFSRGTLLFS